MQYWKYSRLFKLHKLKLTWSGCAVIHICLWQRSKQKHFSVTHKHLQEAATTTVHRYGFLSVGYAYSDFILLLLTSKWRHCAWFCFFTVSRIWFITCINYFNPLFIYCKMSKNGSVLFLLENDKNIVMFNSNYFTKNLNFINNWKMNRIIE